MLFVYFDVLVRKNKKLFKHKPQNPIYNMGGGVWTVGIDLSGGKCSEGPPARSEPGSAAVLRSFSWATELFLILRPPDVGTLFLGQKCSDSFDQFDTETREYQE